jgi:hypothetical protein
MSLDPAGTNSDFQWDFDCMFAPNKECFRVVKLAKPTCTSSVLWGTNTSAPCQDTTAPCEWNMIVFRANQQNDPTHMDSNQYRVNIGNASTSYNLAWSLRIRFALNCSSDDVVPSQSLQATDYTGAKLFWSNLQYDYTTAAWFVKVGPHMRETYSPATVDRKLCLGVYYPTTGYSNTGHLKFFFDTGYVVQLDGTAPWLSGPSLLRIHRLSPNGGGFVVLTVEFGEWIDDKNITTSEFAVVRAPSSYASDTTAPNPEQDATYMNMDPTLFLFPWSSFPGTSCLLGSRTCVARFMMTELFPYQIGFRQRDWVQNLGWRWSKVLQATWTKSAEIISDTSTATWSGSDTTTRSLSSTFTSTASAGITNFQ